MLISYKHGQNGVILRVKVLNSASDVGAGLQGLTYASPNLKISTIADNESIAVVYSSATGTIETISSLGAYSAPTATKCRFRELDASSHPGVYELRLHDSRFSVTGARSLLITISGATNAMESDALIPLTSVNPYAVNWGYDPWGAAVPAANATGTAGNRLGFLDAAVSSRSTFAGGAVASVVNPVVVGINNDKSGYSLGAAGLDSIIVESGVNARQALSPILAALGGTVSGAGSGTITVRAGNGTETRITASTDAQGNRTSVTLTLPT